MESVLLTQGSWKRQREIVDALVLAYATQFWCGTWRELLAIRDADGCIEQQFGTFDQYGSIYPETQQLLELAGIGEDDPNWPNRLWALAESGELRTVDGRLVTPYWSLDSARQELLRFVTSTDSDGYGGELLVLVERSQIVGFTAYTCLRDADGRQVADKRFPVERLHIPIDSPEATQMCLGEYLKSQYGESLTLGIFLDHAVSEVYRGQRLGSRLFDERITRLLELGAEVILGRTILTSPRQYRGNYLARGLRPFAADGTDAFSLSKHYFCTEVSELTPRAS
ncbi:MAG: hypothetical protein HQ488_04825 [Parcubacteria group bacterium]|nr:hypothetical protein [Parcubacteria group bacterium]